jgi:EcsC protein family
MFEEIDIHKLRGEVERLRSETSSYDPAERAEILTRRAAVRCAAAGAMTGLPGGVFAVATLGADLAYLVYQQFRLVLGIATIYGHEPSQRDRFGEALSCLAYGSGIGLGKQGLAAVLESAAAESGLIGEKIGTRVLRESVGRAIPFIGAVSGGVLNYFAVRAVGRATIRYYEAKLDPTLAEEIWAEGDREHA